MSINRRLDELWCIHKLLLTTKRDLLTNTQNMGDPQNIVEQENPIQKNRS